MVATRERKRKEWLPVARYRVTENCDCGWSGTATNCLPRSETVDCCGKRDQNTLPKIDAHWTKITETVQWHRRDTAQILMIINFCERIIPMQESLWMRFEDDHRAAVMLCEINWGRCPCVQVFSRRDPGKSRSPHFIMPCPGPLCMVTFKQYTV